MNILRLDAALRTEGSTTRALTDRLIAGLGNRHSVTSRDLSERVSPIDPAWVAANLTPAEERTPAERATLALSDELIGELEDADLIVIGLPVYNFGVPAGLKAWVDQVCRAHRTFEFTPDGPRGLLHGKRAIALYVSGGTKFGSNIDFASGYLRHILGFIGIDDLTFIDAGRHMVDAGAISGAEASVDSLAQEIVTEKAA